ncbi:hypothetical protein C2S53_000043 [Perilla frutescens var. hirtella]|uniref:Uncharacterized protein n=1 Tax=Perilla frutescens var. hirtella TaxID=608512 RepID=A0AAD4PD58_PERFH|nr:hypothetical protein C2S53_000043 [Perilla frutescens var. hirtella]
MVKTFQRAVRANVDGARPNTTANIGGANAKAGKSKNFNKQPPTSPKTALTLSSSSSALFPSLINLPISAASSPSWVPSSTVCSDESEWERVDIIEGETAARGFYEDYLFGTVPSSDEVQHAVSALQQALGSSSYREAKQAEATNNDYAVEVANSICVDEKMISLAGSEMDWIEPSQNLYGSKMLKDPRSDMVCNAFHLLETEPCVQRMVVSLSSDKAVWDAVLKNEVVKELRGSIHRVGKSSNEGSDGSNGGGDEDDILSWIVMFAKAKIMQLLNKITELVNNVFVEKKGNSLDEKVRSSFFLSIVVVIIVVLARTKTKNA